MKGPSLKNRQGFTLIELLIVVVIIGILAAIAIPRFGQQRERAFVSAMQSDLNQARTSMELCYQDPGAGSGIYTYEGCTLQDIGVPDGGTGYTLGVTLAISGASATDYIIDASHTGTDSWTCSYQHTGGDNPGQIVCDEDGDGGGDPE